ncbi:MAG: polyprenol monophosphomannose synthase [Terrimicrobiaceae bacterium]|nr:polyprenol monophosphomannose synthase [Terrimicrobiaceae bacterium]
MRRSLPAFLLFLAAYLAVIGWGWFQQTATGGELSGHAAKIEAILRLLRSGDFAWFPGYLSGSPTATLLSFALSIPVYAPALLLAPNPAVAMKATGLLLLALGGLAAFAFGRRLARDGWTGFAVGCAYLLAPQVLLRLGWQEHMTIVVAIPLVPLAFLALLRVADRGTPFDGVLLGTAFSATLLAWSKMGATLAIPLALFAGWLFVSRADARSRLLRGAAWAIPTVLLLGVAPLLPLLRERGFMTVFELDPFRQWQAAYSVKTATSWFDRGGELFSVLPQSLRIDGGGYYLGLVGFAAVAVTVGLTWSRRHDGREVAAIRLFLLLALAMFWVSFGPRSVLQGQFELLSHAENFPDIAITLHWLALAAQGVFLYWCLPPARWRGPAFAALFAVYLLVPAFRIVERLPLYADLRAPDSFWILNGTFAWAVGSAMAAVFVLRTLVAPRFLPLVSAAALAAACADFSPYFNSFYHGGLAPDVSAQFREVSDKLRGGSDRVLAISGRYFYLDLPNRSGRPLSTEALNHYLMPADTARLQVAARLSATHTLSYLQLAGISDVVIERSDSDVPESIQQWFRAMLPLRFENKGFLVLSNPYSLYPGFFAESAVPAADGYREYVGALAFAKNQTLTIASPDALPLDTLPGMKTSAAAKSTRAPDFVRLAPAQPRTASRVAFSTPGKAGWVVLDESWHPDWKAAVDGAPALVYRAAGGLPATPVHATDHLVEFRFEPPSWYAACLAASSLGWLAALGLIASAPLLPRRLFEPQAPENPPPEASGPRTPIIRPLALIPTRDEAGTIVALLDRILETRSDLQALVIDDASPDGTAALVRAHAAHGSRIHLIERAGKLGLGSAYRAGFQWAMDHAHDACIEIDADFSHDPADIPRLLAALDAGADAAVGSRYLDGVRVINWPEHRLILSAGASRYVRMLTGLPLTDATSGFKALRTAALRGIDWSRLRADGYGFQIELHWLLWTAGYRLAEVPIVFTERRVGQTKMTLGIAVEAALRVIQLGLLHPSRRPASIK